MQTVVENVRREDEGLAGSLLAIWRNVGFVVRNVGVVMSLDFFAGNTKRGRGIWRLMVHTALRKSHPSLLTFNN